VHLVVDQGAEDDQGGGSAEHPESVEDRPDGVVGVARVTATHKTTVTGTSRTTAMIFPHPR
jgi:hypothetical protein